MWSHHTGVNRGFDFWQGGRALDRTVADRFPRGEPWDESTYFGLMTHAAETEVWIIRHGETNWNIEHRLQGQLQEPSLTLAGEQQSHEAAHSLRRLSDASKFDQIFCSDLRRAQQTAQILFDCDLACQPPQSLPALRERFLGPLEVPT